MQTGYGALCVICLTFMAAARMSYHRSQTDREKDCENGREDTHTHTHTHTHTQRKSTDKAQTDTHSHTHTHTQTHTHTLTHTHHLQQ